MVEITYRYRNGKELSEELCSATFPRDFSIDQIILNYGRDIVIQSYKVVGWAMIDAKIKKVFVHKWDNNHAYFNIEDGCNGILPAWQVFETESKASEYFLSQRF